MPVLSRKEYESKQKPPVSRPVPVEAGPVCLSPETTYCYVLCHDEYITRREHKFGVYDSCYGIVRVYTEDESNTLVREWGFRLLSKEEVQE